MLSVEECIENCRSETKCFGFNFVAGKECQLLTNSIHSKSGKAKVLELYNLIITPHQSREGFLPPNPIYVAPRLQYTVQNVTRINLPK